MGLKHLIQETLSNYGIIEDGGGCGCGKAEDKMALLESKTPISEGLRYHIENGVSLQENVFRIGSKKYLELFAEARLLNEWGVIQLDENSRHLVENTDIGKFGILNGKKVPLDIPMVVENTEQQTLQKILTQLQAINANTDDAEPELNDANLELDRLKDAFDLMTSLLAKKGVASIRTKQKALEEGEDLDEAKKKKKKKKDPPIGKPMRSSSGGSAYKVYVRDPKTGNVKTVRFGSGGLRAKIKNPKARNAFAKRHKCSQKKDRTKASYWSCNLPRYAPALGLGNKMNTYW
jgi:hypothetical protein